jgi:hypothetical protein
MAQPTVTRRVSAHQYPVRYEVPVERLVARECGITDGTAHQWLYGERRVNLRAAAIIRAFHLAGQPERAARWLIPIEEAKNGLAQPPLTADLILTAQRADLEEDHAESRYLNCPTPEHARLWRMKCEAQLGLNVQLIGALRRLEA